ncbi:MAG: 8-amino-7-oxononanoate synthase [Burkholderiales bacterium]|jgi:8-amino-7-oxononanoate synthase|nr:8-amino-7-oxononanoate synthase [Nitrosomonadaceae bacterium]
MPVDDFGAQLSELAQADQLRARRIVGSAQDASMLIDGQRVLSFASNDYLGLANHPRVVEATMRALKKYGLGAGASHMVTGHHALHEELEARLATFSGFPRALLFGSGYAANLGILTALAGRGDTIFADKLNHACLNDGALLSRANFKRYPHNDIGKLRAMLADSAKGASNTARRLIVADAVFSMDGDIAPVPELLELAEEYDALLVLDDAHGFGVLGYRGRGVLEHFNLIGSDAKPANPRIVYMATLGKAAGGYGAFVAGHEDVVEWIMQAARTYLFSTATPPALAAGAIAALDVMQEDHERRRHLRTLIDFFSDSLKLQYAKLPFSQTAIQPIIVGSNHDALAFAEALRERHFLVPAIRPPTVPNGTARLRVSLSSNHVADDVFDLITAITDIEVQLLGQRA